jgi:hypothetical protein
MWFLLYEAITNIFTIFTWAIPVGRFSCNDNNSGESDCVYHHCKVPLHEHNSNKKFEYTNLICTVPNFIII